MVALWGITMVRWRTMHESVYRWGSAPFMAAVLHGGPGARGDARDLAQALAPFAGVLEPLQTENSIDGQIAELRTQLEAHADGPCVLIGHSWGAWLAILFARQHPEAVSRIVLVGAGPLTDACVPDIGRRRKENLTAEEADAFDALLQDMDAPGALSRLGALCDKADSYAPLPSAQTQPTVDLDETQYASIWPEAARLRTTGALLNACRGIRCLITILHGDRDPHPPEGVTQPLEDANIPYEATILSRCGHTPWRERYARDACLAQLRNVLHR